MSKQYQKQKERCFELGYQKAREKELKEEIQRMSDIYEVSELSEESGLQDEFEKDVYKIYNLGYQKAREKELVFLKSMQISQFRAGSSLYEEIQERIKQLSEDLI